MPGKACARESPGIGGFGIGGDQIRGCRTAGGKEKLSMIKGISNDEIKRAQAYNLEYII
jgi:hypothetical protein